MGHFEKPNSITNSVFSSFRLVEKAVTNSNELSLTGFLHSHEYSNNDFWVPGYFAIMRSSLYSNEMIKLDIRMLLRQEKFSPPDLRDLHVQT